MTMFKTLIILLITSFNCMATTSWKLDNVQFSDQGTATGTFDYNESTGECKNVEITVNGQLYGNIPQVFKSGQDRVICSNSSIDICEFDCPGGSKYFKLQFFNKALPWGDLSKREQVLHVKTGAPNKGSYYGVGSFSSAKGSISGVAIEHNIVHLEFDNVKFSDNATLSGRYDYNLTTSQCEHVNIEINGPLYRNSLEYFSSSDRVRCSENSIDVCQSNCLRGSKYFRLEFDSTLTNRNLDVFNIKTGAPNKGSYYGEGSFYNTKGGMNGAALVRPTIIAQSGVWLNSGGRSSTNPENPITSFYLFKESLITIDLNSYSDTYLYLLKDPTGSSITENDDSNGTLNSQISITLKPGMYFIVAATYSEGQQAPFTLSVTGQVNGFESVSRQ